MSGIITVNERAPRIAGGMVHLDQTVLDIDRRIKYGDESGWRGDPSMGLYWNPASMMYEVIGVDRTGQQYLAASHDRCDHTLLMKLVAGDPRKHNVAAEVLARNEKLRADADAAAKEKRLEVADKMHHAVKKDLGHHMGGTKRLYTVDGLKKD